MRKSVWERLMEDRLRTIAVKLDAYTTASDHLDQLRSAACEVKGPVLSRVPISGTGGNREEGRRLNNIALQEEIERNLAKLRQDVELHEKNWPKLTDQERTVLDYFYINRQRNHMQVLMKKFHCEKSTVYRMKDDALFKLTMLTYGDK